MLMWFFVKSHKENLMGVTSTITLPWAQTPNKMWEIQGPFDAHFVISKIFLANDMKMITRSNGDRVRDLSFFLVPKTPNDLQNKYL